MSETTKLIVSIAAIGVALAALILTTSNAQREDLRELRRDVHTLTDRVVRLEGLVSGILAGHRPGGLARAPADTATDQTDE